MRQDIWVALPHRRREASSSVVATLAVARSSDRIAVIIISIIVISIIAAS